MMPWWTALIILGAGIIAFLTVLFILWKWTKDERIKK